MKEETNLLWLILMLHWAKTIQGRKKFQKMVYLLHKMGMIDFSYHFSPYYFGPYCGALQSDINMLSAMGLVEVSKRGDMYVHQLTDEGDKQAGKLLKLTSKTITGEKTRKISKEVRKLSQMDTPELVTRSKQIMASGLNGHILLRLWG